MSSNRTPVSVRVGEAPEIQAFLADRIYEFNSKTTGLFDGETFSATQTDASNAIRAGIYGYTWGGCCYIAYLWVDEADRRKGAGTALMRAAEEHAKTKGCSILLLATHSFQAPAFYESLGYEQQAVLHDHPVGHASLYFAKRLA